ncbi:MAG TPA: hypothetical protein VLM37_12020 [Fibrobacteraceae bacterium]|nr:hypothetical protein [Fibrobacteraceae bacterium]
MDALFAFYKIHYNFAAVAVLFFLWALSLLLRGNFRWFSFVFLGVLAYNLVLKHAVDTNPVWFEQVMEKAESFDFVDYIWGGSAVSKQKATSEQRMNQ